MSLVRKLGWALPLAVLLTGCPDNNPSPPPAPPPPPAKPVPPAPAPDAAQWFIVTADPQYPWTPFNDGTTKERPADDQALSRQLITEQYDSINRFATDKNVRATFINGDLTAYGHAWQVSYMQEAIARLKQPVYLGLGNHDYENNLDCTNEVQNCVRRSVYWFVDHMSKHNLLSFDVAVRRFYQFPANREEVYGSYGWRQDFDDVVVLQLNNHPEYRMFAEGYSVGRGLQEHINVRPALRWLEMNLNEARAQGKVIVLMMHKPPTGKALAELVGRYRVDAIFAGHEHARQGEAWYEIDGKRVRYFHSGSASQKTYLLLEHRPDRRELIIHAVAQNNADAKKEIARIALPREKLPMPMKAYGFSIRVHNMGGYNAGYWLDYKLGAETLRQEMHLSLGEGHEFQIPAGATDINLVGSAYTGLVWAPWKEFYHHKMGRSMIDHCYTNWGTTLSPSQGAC